MAWHGSDGTRPRYMTYTSQKNNGEKKKAGTQASSAEEKLIIASLSAMYSILKPVKEGDNEDAAIELKRKLKMLNSPEFKENCRQMADKIEDFIGVPQSVDFAQDLSKESSFEPKLSKDVIAICNRLKGSNDEGTLVLEEAILSTNPALVKGKTEADAFRQAFEEQRLRRYSQALQMLQCSQDTNHNLSAGVFVLFSGISGLLAKAEKWAFKISVYEFSFLSGYPVFDLIALLVIIFSVYLSILKSSGQILHHDGAMRAFEHILVIFFIFEL